MAMTSAAYKEALWAEQTRNQSARKSEWQKLREQGDIKEGALVDLSAEPTKRVVIEFGFNHGGAFNKSKALADLTHEQARKNRAEMARVCTAFEQDKMTEYHKQEQAAKQAIQSRDRFKPGTLVKIGYDGKQAVVITLGNALRLDPFLGRKHNTTSAFVWVLRTDGTIGGFKPESLSLV